MDFEELTELIVELEVDDIADAVRVALEEDGKDPFEILTALTKGMDEVSRRYEEFEYFLGELVLAGDTMKAGLEVLKPALAVSDSAKEKVKVVIATVKGDQHDLGKNLLQMNPPFPYLRRTERYEKARFASPRREHVEQGEPFYRLDRC